MMSNWLAAAGIHPQPLPKPKSQAKGPGSRVPLAEQKAREKRRRKELAAERAAAAEDARQEDLKERGQFGFVAGAHPVTGAHCLWRLGDAELPDPPELKLPWWSWPGGPTSAFLIPKEMFFVPGKEAAPLQKLYTPSPSQLRRRAREAAAAAAAAAAADAAEASAADEAAPPPAKAPRLQEPEAEETASSAALPSSSLRIDSNELGEHHALHRAASPLATLTEADPALACHTQHLHHPTKRHQHPYLHLRQRHHLQLHQHPRQAWPREGRREGGDLLAQGCTALIERLPDGGDSARSATLKAASTADALQSSAVHACTLVIRGMHACLPLGSPPSRTERSRRPRRLNAVTLAI